MKKSQRVQPGEIVEGAPVHDTTFNSCHFKRVINRTVELGLGERWWCGEPDESGHDPRAAAVVILCRCSMIGGTPVVTFLAQIARFLIEQNC